MDADGSLEVVFYRTESGNEPVREWLKRLSKQDKKTIGGDIKTVQYGWPLGMPVVRKMDHGLWKIRCRLDKRIARILFTVKGKPDSCKKFITKVVFMLWVKRLWLGFQNMQDATGGEVKKSPSPSGRGPG